MLRNGKRFRCEENEPGSSNQPAHGRNPLLNHVVLTRLFEFFSVSDLLRYQLVSKEWYSSSLSRIRNEATVKISNSHLDYLNWTTFHKNFQVAGKQFKGFKLFHVDFFDSPPPSKLPKSSYQNILLEGQNVNIEQMYKNMDQFWKQCGQFIYRLKLASSSVYSVGAFNRAIFEDMPNLEVLTLWDLVIPNGHVPLAGEGREDKVMTVNHNLKELNIICWKHRGHPPISWSILFNHFPKILRLKLNIDSNNAIGPLVSKLEAQDEILLQVLELNIISSQQSTSLQRLFQLGKLKLTSLHLTLEILSNRDEDRRILQAALGVQGDTLESLFVSTSCHKLVYDELEQMSNFPVRPEPLQNLTHLELRGSLCPNFHFLQQTPNLKILRLCWNRSLKVPNEIDLEMMGSTKLPFLEEFYFHSKPITGGIMNRFVKMMPNVERFYALINSQAFQVVCENWRKLTVLVIEDVWNKNLFPEVDYVGDEAITGIVRGCEGRLPNITDLQCLEELKIMNTGRIGDASIWNGFLKLTKLSTLHVTLSRKTSDRAFDVLLKRFPDGNCRRSGPPPSVYRI